MESLRVHICSLHLHSAESCCQSWHS